MKTVILSSNTSWTIYNFRLGRIKSLKAKGYRVVLFAKDDGYFDKLKEYVDEIVDLRFFRNGSVNPIVDILLLLEYLIRFLLIRPNAVMSYTIKPNIYGTIAASVVNSSPVMCINGLGSVFIKGGLIKQIVKFMYKFACFCASKVVFQNHDDRNFFVDSKLVSNEKSLVILGSGVDTQFYKPLGLEKKYDLVFVGRLIREKGIFELLKAYQEIQESGEQLKLCVVGSTWEGNPSSLSLSEIQSLKEKYIGINFLGKVENVSEVVSQARFLVLPTYREGLPKSVIEAQSLGVPCLVSEVPGCKEVIEHHVNGYFFQSKNANSLEVIIREALNLSEGLYETMSTKAREIAKNKFSSDVVIPQYVGVLNNLLFKFEEHKEST